MGPDKNPSPDHSVYKQNAVVKLFNIILDIPQDQSTRRLVRLALEAERHDNVESRHRAMEVVRNECMAMSVSFAKITSIAQQVSQDFSKVINQLEEESIKEYINAGKSIYRKAAQSSPVVHRQNQAAIPGRRDFRN